MRNAKKFLALTLAGVFCVGTVLTVNAAPFDADWYATQNPDVVAVYGNAPEALKAHYDKYGRLEHRMSSESDVAAQLYRFFDVDEYKAMYPDVAKVFGDNAEAIFNHYLEFGILEGRRASEDMSWDAAQEIKFTLTDALTKAGLDAKPGSADLLQVIKGDVSVGDASLQETMTQVQSVVKDTVNLTVVAGVIPSDSDDSDSNDSGCGGGSSSGSGSGSSGTPGDATNTNAVG